MANILLGVTGSVAAVRTPLLFQQLSAAGHAVKVLATPASVYFFDPAEVGGANGVRNSDVMILDGDEWPGERYARGDRVVHIDLRTWADVFVLAPLDANTLAKLAVGLSDNALTCVWRAWDWAKPVVLAPAMNTLMWQHPLTRKHLRSLAADFGAGHIPASFDEEQLVAQINDRAKALRIVGPISKALACSDTGVGAMAEVPDIVAAVTAAVTWR